MSKKWISMSWSLLLLLQFGVNTVCSQSRCYSSVSDLRDLPLPSERDALYLPTSATERMGQQVIVPEMRFDCAGFVTGWSAHTAILTAPNFLDLLTHIITFQVWRPDSSGDSYQLVGSNQISFGATGMELNRNNITALPGRDDMAFFTFNKVVEQSEQIYFLPGDVVGWFIPFRTINSPLSPLYRVATPEDNDAAIVDLYHKAASEQQCSFCNVEGSPNFVLNTVPMVAVSSSELGLDGTCSQTEHVCPVIPPPTSDPPTANPVANTDPNPATHPATTTTPDPSGQMTMGGRNTFSVAETVCISLVAITLLLHLVMVLLCAANLVVMKKIKTALHSRTMAVSPGVRSPSNFKLNTISPTHTRVKDETPADYDPVEVGKGRDKEQSLQFQDEDSDKMGSLASSLNRHMANSSRGGSLADSKMGSLASINKQLSDSRTGSREDLIRIRGGGGGRIDLV